jgi:hypothetical protein
MTASIYKKARMMLRSQQKLAERNAILYARSLERWNTKTPIAS